MRLFTPERAAVRALRAIPRAAYRIAFSAALAAFANPAWTAEAGSGALVELIVPSEPGSGMDIATRTIKQLVDGAKLLSGSTVVMNKPGAGGAIAYQYLNQNAGSGRHLAIASPSLVTNKMMGIGTIDARDVTPVATIFSENIVFMVRAGSPIDSGKSLIARLRKDPSSVSFGIATALGGANHIAAASFLKGAGIDVNAPLNVVYKSGSGALYGLLSGEVEVVPVATLVSLPQMTAGKVRVVAISSPERLGGPYAGIPTLTELGIDSTYTSWRMIVAPRGAKESDVRASAAALEAMVAMPEWKAHVEKNFWISRFRGPDASRAFLDEQWKLHHTLLSQLRLGK